MKSFLTIILILSIFVIFASLQIIQKERYLADKIYPNVSINNIDFGNKPKSEVVKYFTNINNNFRKVKVTILHENNPVATYSGEMLNISYDAEGIADRAYIIGRSSHFPSRLYQKLATVLDWQKFKFVTRLNYDETELKYFLEESRDKYNKPAKNALFSFENNRVISFRQEEIGLIIEEEKFLKNLDDSIFELEKKVKDIQVQLPIAEIEPEVTLAKANDFGIEELIAEGKSDYSHSIPGRIHNVILAASKFNGVLIPKGKVFSF